MLAQTTNIPVIMPDIFDGDPAFFGREYDPSFDLAAWKVKHDPDEAVNRFLPWARDFKDKYGVEQLGALGYCYGAKLVLGLGAANDDILSAGFVGHPSAYFEGDLANDKGYTSPRDFNACKVPLSIAAAENDEYFPQQKRWETESLLKQAKSRDGQALAWQVCLYSGVEHGFAIRQEKGHLEQVATKAAFRQAVGWMEAWLEL
jgi:dienelactone hydrolase